MGSYYSLTNKDNKYTNNKPNNILLYIKSKYFIEKIFDNLKRKISLKIMKYNKKILNKLNISIKDYKEYSDKNIPIELEIIPIGAHFRSGIFINILEEEKKFFHIFFDDSKTEVERTSLNYEDKIKKIKILIDYQVKSFENLFKHCNVISSICFKKFYRDKVKYLIILPFCNILPLMKSAK